MAMMSDTFTSMSLLPSWKGLYQSSEKCVFSTIMSTVTRVYSLPPVSSTAQSSPTPRTTEGSLPGAPVTRFMKANSPPISESFMNRTASCTRG